MLFVMGKMVIWKVQTKLSKELLQCGEFSKKGSPIYKAQSFGSILTAGGKENRLDVVA